MSPDSPSLPTIRRPGRPDPHVIVLFGVTGDLARRKLLPGLFHLAAAGMLPERYRIVGTARSRRFSEAGFKEYAHDAVAEFATVKPTGDAWRGFEDALSSPPPTGPTRPRWSRPCRPPRRSSAVARSGCSTLPFPRWPSSRPSGCWGPPAWPRGRG